MEKNRLLAVIKQSDIRDSLERLLAQGDSLEACLQHLQVVEVPARTTLIREGQPIDQVYYVVRGDLLILKAA